MPEPGKTMTPAGTMSSMRSLRLKGAALPSRGPVGLEGDLRHLAIIGPAGGGSLGAFWRTAMDQHHVGMLGEHLIEHGPDALMIGVIGAAGKGDLRAFRKHQFGVGVAARGDEVAAVDHGGGQVPVVDEAARAGTPG